MPPRWWAHVHLVPHLADDAQHPRRPAQQGGVHTPDAAQARRVRVRPAAGVVHWCECYWCYWCGIGSHSNQNLTFLAPDAAERKRLEECFVEYHPDAKWWVPGDPDGAHSSLWSRLDITDIYYIGGFGK